MNKAAFLDRDGVINKNVLNPKTGEYESPHYESDFEIFPFVIKALQKLIEKGYYLFLVSNQPSYAKGKTSLENIKKIHEKFDRIIKAEKIYFKEYYYCYHHPAGIVPEYSFDCNCRKPKPYFLLKAKIDYELDMPDSWLIGDRDTDIFCGQAAGVKTILIENENEKKKKIAGQIFL